MCAERYWSISELDVDPLDAGDVGADSDEDDEGTSGVDDADGAGGGEGDDEDMWVDEGVGVGDGAALVDEDGAEATAKLTDVCTLELEVDEDDKSVVDVETGLGVA